MHIRILRLTRIEEISAVALAHRIDDDNKSVNDDDDNSSDGNNNMEEVNGSDVDEGDECSYEYAYENKKIENHCTLPLDGVDLFEFPAVETARSIGGGNGDDK